MVNFHAFYSRVGEHESKYQNVAEEYGDFCKYTGQELADLSFDEGVDDPPLEFVGEDLLPFLEQLNKGIDPRIVAREAAEFIRDNH